MSEEPRIIRKLTWSMVTHGMIQICTRMHDEYFFPDGIVAVARGGLIPATILAHHLKLHKVISIGLASYADGEMHNGELTSYGSLPEELLEQQGLNWLVIDDIVDSGTSMAYMRRLLPKAKTACLFQQEQAPLCDFWWNRLRRGVWIKFPWEQRL